MPTEITLGLRQSEAPSMAQFLIWATECSRVLPIKTQQGERLDVFIYINDLLILRYLALPSVT